MSTAKLEPYALAIGQTTLAWNELHETLGALFCKVLGGSTDMDHKMQCMAVWGSVSNDRQKRILLEAAVNWMGEKRHKEFPELAPDILYLIGRANSLEDKRNNVIHAPLEEVSSVIVAAMIGKKVGDVYPGGVLNDHALKLANSTIHVGKDLLTEINRYRDYAEYLDLWASAIFQALEKPDGTWPKRPSLPPLKDKA